LADDLHQHALSPSAVEFALKYLFPPAEIEAAARDGDDDFPAHDLALEAGVGVGHSAQKAAQDARRAGTLNQSFFRQLFMKGINL